MVNGVFRLWSERLALVEEHGIDLDPAAMWRALETEIGSREQIEAAAALLEQLYRALSRGTCSPRPSNRWSDRRARLLDGAVGGGRRGRPARPEPGDAPVYPQRVPRFIPDRGDLLERAV